MVLVMAAFLLVFFTLVQMASQSVHSVLSVSFIMGLIASFIGAMLIFNLHEFDWTLLFKILFISQVIASVLTFFIRVQNCIQPRQWQFRYAESIDRAFNPALRVMGLDTSCNNQCFYKEKNSFSSSGTSSNNTSGLGINLNNLSISEANTSILKDDTQNQSMVQLTVGDVCVPLKEIYYITDTVVVNKALARKLKKSNLQGSYIMVRASKQLIYDSSEQIEIG